jgi:hypothetical protein
MGEMGPRVERSRQDGRDMLETVLRGTELGTGIIEKTNTDNEEQDRNRVPYRTSGNEIVTRRTTVIYVR